MAKEAVVLYCLTKGFLDNIAIEDIQKFEQVLYRQLDVDTEGINIVKYINDNKVLPEADVLDRFIQKAKKLFM